MDSPPLLKKIYLENIRNVIYVHSEHKEQKTVVGMDSSVLIYACM
jgi:hypothetical protein